MNFTPSCQNAADSPIFTEGVKGSSQVESPNFRSLPRCDHDPISLCLPLAVAACPARFLGFRHLSPGCDGNLPPGRRSCARLCSGIVSNEFFEGSDRVVQSVEFFLCTAAFCPDFPEHPTEIGHPTSFLYHHNSLNI